MGGKLRRPPVPHRLAVAVLLAASTVTGCSTAAEADLMGARNSLGMCCRSLRGRQEPGQWLVASLQPAWKLWCWSTCEVERGATICRWSSGSAGRLSVAWLSGEEGAVGQAAANLAAGA